MLWLMPLSLQAASSNPYDLVAKTIEPLLGPLTNAPPPSPRGLDASLLIYPLDEQGRTQKSARPATLRILFQAPGQLLLEGSLDDRRGVVCRNNQHVWAAPRVVIAPFLEQLQTGQTNGQTNTLPDMILPIKASQAALLPALLELRERSTQRIGERNCVVIQARLLDQLAESLSLGDWQVLLWIDQQDSSLQRVKVAGPGWSGRIDVLQLKAVSEFPQNVWRPAPDVDAVDVPVGVLMPAIAALLDVSKARQ